MMNFTDPTNFADFDGLSDFSETASNAINTLTNVIRNRLQSMLNHQIFTPKIVSFANKIVQLLPSEIHFPDSEFFLEGILYANPVSKENVGVQVPLKTLFESENHYYVPECQTILPPYIYT